MTAGQHRAEPADRRLYANWRTAVLIAAALAILILAMTGCGGSAPTASSHARSLLAPSSAASSGTRLPAQTATTCRQQYDAWKGNGAATLMAKQLTADLGRVQTAGSDEDIVALRSALIATGATAAKLASYPAMPACADPHGYWRKMLGYLRAAGDNASAASGLGALLLAEAPLEKVPAVEAKLTAELKKAAASDG